MLDPSKIWIKYPEHLSVTNNIYNLKESFDYNFDDKVSKDDIEKFISEELEEDGEYVILTPETTIEVNKKSEQLFKNYSQKEIRYVTAIFDSIQENENKINARYFNQIKDTYTRICKKQGVNLKFDMIHCDYEITIEQDSDIVNGWIEELIDKGFWYLGKEESTLYEKDDGFGRNVYNLYFKLIPNKYKNIFNFVEKHDSIIDCIHKETTAYETILENPNYLEEQDESFLFVTNKTINSQNIHTDKDIYTKLKQKLVDPELLQILESFENNTKINKINTNLINTNNEDNNYYISFGVTK